MQLTADAMDHVTEIPPETHLGDGSITIADIPGTVRTIGDRAYAECENLIKVDVPEGVERIGEEAFMGCVELCSLSLPSTLKEIGAGFISGCTSLARVTIREGGDFSVQDGCVFNDRTGTLVAYPPGREDRRVNIPAITKNLADRAFEGCSNIMEIAFDRHPEAIGKDVFRGCDRLIQFGICAMRARYRGGILRSEDGDTIIRCPPRCRVRDVSLDGVVTVLPGAFSGCTRIRALTITPMLDNVYPELFDDLPDLRLLRISAGSTCIPPLRFTDAGGNPIPPHLVPGNIYVKLDDGSFMRTPNNEEFEADEGENDPLGRLFRNIERRGEPKPVKIEGTTLDSVAGLEDVKRTIRDHIIMPRESPELFERYGKSVSTGILMYGPPGTGKTMLARAIACELGADFFSIKPSDIYNKYVGESESRIRRLFETAGKSKKAVIFFDDFDSIGSSRGNDSTPWQNNMVNELLTQIQGLEGRRESIIVLAATNRPWMLDSALRRSGRFSEQIYVHLPDAESRRKILETNLRNCPLSDADIDAIVKRTEGYNGADLSEIVERAKMIRIHAVRDGDDDGITTDDLLIALRDVPSTVNPKDLRDLDTYSRTGVVESEDVFVPIGTERYDPAYR